MKRASGIVSSGAPVFVLALICCLTAGLATAQPAEYYRGNAQNGDLWATQGAVVTFNTTTGTMTAVGGVGGTSASFGFATQVGGGVQVFRFRNVFLPEGVNVVVQGTRPMVLAADRDMYIGTNINVSGNVAGRGGGGIGGNGGGGGASGAGGSNNGSQGAGGVGGNGGQEGAIFDSGAAGGVGQFGFPGGDGERGVAGSNGTTGAFGTNGFNIPGSGSPGGNGGEGGKDNGQGGVLGAGGNTLGGGGGGGSAGAGSGGNGSPGGVGGPGSPGGNATGGENGDDGSLGADGSFPLSANTLEIYGGVGGGGGGGGGGGQGGGQGGGGGGGRGGGGGGGGGRGLLGSIASGGNGGQGGTGGTGGRGATGGPGGTGGGGGKGGNGGGAVILSARGLLEVLPAGTPRSINISAGTVSAGTGGTTGGLPGSVNGGTGGLPGAGGQNGDCTLFGTVCGGNGGSGGPGGPGAGGGTGATGGSGGQGGTGGYGTPGMLKLHGSIVLASNMELLAGNNRPVSDLNANGKLTFISNMTPAAAANNLPSLVPTTVETANTVNADILGQTRFDGFIDHPYLPGLLIGNGPTGSELTEGIVRSGDPHIPDYYQRSLVEDVGNPADFTLGDGSHGIDGQIISGANNLFQNHEQIFVINRSGSNIIDLFLQVDANTPRRINGGTGELAAGAVWTTTIRTGATPRLLQTPSIISQPSDVFVFPGENPTMSVAVSDLSGSAITFQWESNQNNVWQPMVEDPTPPNGVTGTTTNVLQFLDVQPPSIEGLYRVIITNETGESVISRATRLSIYPPPEIVTQPVSVRKFPQSTHVFDVEASGFQVNYEWFFAPNITGDPNNPAPGVYQSIANGGLIAEFTDDVTGELSDALFFQEIALIHEGFYYVTATNLSGSVSSDTVTLIVERAPEIIQQPENLVVPAGNDATFSIVTRGIVTAYDWQRSRGPSGFPWELDAESTNSPTFTVTNAQDGLWDGGPGGPATCLTCDEAWFRCRVSGAGFQVPSIAVSLIVGDPGILDQPDSRQVNPGQNLNTIGNPAFSVVADTSFPPLTYAWYKEAVGGDLLVGGPGPENYLLLANIQEPAEGNYYVVITNSAVPTGSVESDRAFLDVRNPPIIVEQPGDITTALGTGVQLRVTASSDSPMTYQWQYRPLDLSTNFTNITSDDGGRIQGYFSTSPPGVHTRLLEIFPSIIADEGIYRVQVISAGVGSVFSNSATVLLGNPLELLGWGIDGIPGATLKRVYVNTVLTRMTVTTQGGLGPRTYQWLVDRSDGNGFVPAAAPAISNSDPATIPLELINVGFNNAGLYNVEVTDSRPPVITLPQNLQLEVYDLLGAVTLLGGQEEVVATREDDFTLEVEFAGGIPDFTLEWLKDDGTGSKEFTIVVGVTNATESPASFVLEDVAFEDAGEYAVRVSDSGTQSRLSNSVTITVEEGVPLVSTTGLGLLAGLTALAGAMAARRRRR
jgi:hypothetical protein